MRSLARREVDARDLARLDPERGVEVLARRARPHAQHVGLVGDAKVADLAGDHLQARLGAQEPAPDLLDAAQRSGVVANVHAHLDALVHQRDRTVAIALVELLEEVVHRVDGTHAGAGYGLPQPGAVRLPRRLARASEPSRSTITCGGRGRPL